MRYRADALAIVLLLLTSAAFGVQPDDPAHVRIKGTRADPFVLGREHDPEGSAVSQFTMGLAYWEKQRVPGLDDVRAVLDFWHPVAGFREIPEDLWAAFPKWTEAEFEFVLSLWVGRIDELRGRINAGEAEIDAWDESTDPQLIKQHLRRWLPSWTESEIDTFYASRADDLERLQRSARRRVTAAFVRGFIEASYPSWPPQLVELLSTLWLSDLEWFRFVMFRVAAFDQLHRRLAEWDNDELWILVSEWTGYADKIWRRLWQRQMTQAGVLAPREAYQNAAFASQRANTERLFYDLLDLSYSPVREQLVFQHRTWSSGDVIEVGQHRYRVVGLSLVEGRLTEYEIHRLSLLPPTHLRSDRRSELAGFLTLQRSDTGAVCSVPVLGLRTGRGVYLRTDEVLSSFRPTTPALRRQTAVESPFLATLYEQVEDSLNNRSELPHVVYGRFASDDGSVELSLDTSILEELCVEGEADGNRRVEDSAPLLAHGKEPEIFLGTFHTGQAVLQLLRAPDSTAGSRRTVVGLLSVYDQLRRGRYRDCEFAEEWHHTVIGEYVGDILVLGEIRWASEEAREPVLLSILAVNGAFREGLGEAVMAKVPFGSTVDFNYPLRIRAMRYGQTHDEGDENRAEDLFARNWLYFKHVMKRSVELQSAQ